MKNPKEKGSKAEREVSRILSLWLSENTRDDLLWRSNSSGGQFTNSRKRSKPGFETEAGDIKSLHPSANVFTESVCMEVKSYKEYNTANLLYNRPCLLRDFWETHLKLSESVNRVPWLIAKENRKPWILLIPRDFISPPYGIVFEEYQLCLFDDFLNKFSYAQIQPVINKWRDKHYGIGRAS